MSHGIHTFHRWTNHAATWTSQVTYECVMSTYERVTSHIWIGHEWVAIDAYVSRVNESWRTHERDMTHTWTSYVTSHINTRCQTFDQSWHIWMRVGIYTYVSRIVSHINIWWYSHIHYQPHTFHIASWHTYQYMMIQSHTLSNTYFSYTHRVTLCLIVYVTHTYVW